MKKFFLKFGLALNLGAVLLLLIAYLAAYVPPDSFWPVSFFGLAYPYFLVLNIFFGVFWGLQRSKRLWISLLAIFLGLTNLTNTYQLFPKLGSSGSGIKVLSFNVHGFRSDLRTSKVKSPKFVDYFKSHGSEIICLQEAIFVKGGKLSPEGLKAALPAVDFYQLASNGGNTGLITLSKFPIVNHGEIHFPGSSNLVLFTDLKVNSRKTIRVYNCHLQSYSIDPDDYSVIDDLGSSPNREQIREAQKVSFKLIKGFELRAYQARKLAEHIQKSPYPVLVCGDFNDTPLSYAYRIVRGDLKDAFVEAGWWTSNTYNGELPSFRIDYMLFDSKLSVSSYARDRVKLSDHFPIRCRLELTD